MLIHGMEMDDNGGISDRSERRLVTNGRSGAKNSPGDDI